MKVHKLSKGLLLAVFALTAVPLLPLRPPGRRSRLTVDTQKQAQIFPSPVGGCEEAAVEI